MSDFFAAPKIIALQGLGPRDLSGKNTRVNHYFLLQVIFSMSQLGIKLMSPALKVDFFFFPPLSHYGQQIPNSSHQYSHISSPEFLSVSRDYLLQNDCASKKTKTNKQKTDSPVPVLECIFGTRGQKSVFLQAPTCNWCFWCLGAIKLDFPQQVTAVIIYFNSF